MNPVEVLDLEVCDKCIEEGFWCMMVRLGMGFGWEGSLSGFEVREGWVFVLGRLCGGNGGVRGNNLVGCCWEGWCVSLNVVLINNYILCEINIKELDVFIN